LYENWLNISISSHRDQLSSSLDSDRGKSKSMSTLQRSLNFLKIGKNDSYGKPNSVTTFDSSDNGDKFSNAGNESIGKFLK
jgi:hypothetical protein